ncbi:glucosamine-6-phosphate deaminase [Virgibacillus sp. C22-A2]|uniref:Glucosamine-6-phosphate deaminase n=1 Tax=Virgibacillus tibetensis TaxID=3042313 RepID=A0ABU6KC29_9BACI|nr:glucosamine-6-phosphate deaminase [Virgibacillus sp. C22-A2]
MEIIKVKDYQQMSEKACQLLKDKIQEREQPVIGLATGSTPEGLYQCLIEKYKRNELSFKDVVTFNLDEYVGLEKDDPNSYAYYMNEKLFKHIDISKEHAHLPGGVTTDLEIECQDYEKLIRDAKHVDVQLLGLGVNGHIGFNEPGTAFTSRTHVVNLDETTRQANARFFNSIDEVPTKAITMGIDTIMESKEILLLVSGESKSEAVARLLQGKVSEDFPASILQEHNRVTILADEAALSKV